MHALLMEGVTVIVAAIAALVELTAVKAGTFPVPLAAKPIAVLEFVQVYVAPEGVLEKLLAPISPPHTFLLAIKFIAGVAVTVIVIAVLPIVAGFAQASLDVSTQVTTCPSVKVEEVYAVLSVPTLTPFTFH